MCTRFASFYSDDAMISLRYADRLLRGRGLTWTDGEWVEGYSNLGWVLLTALLGALGVELVMATRLLGLLALVGLLVAVSWRPGEGPWGSRAWTGGMFAAFTAGFAVWAVGGLSQTLVAALGVGMLQAVRRLGDAPGDRAALALWWLGAGWATVNRIDGFVLVGIVLVSALACGTTSVRPALSGVAASAGTWLGQLGFRLLYYGDPIPNTLRVKVSFTWDLAMRGFEWVRDGLGDNAVLVGAVVAVSALPTRYARDALLAAALWSLYAIYVGGDIFFGHRMLLPALGFGALALADHAQQARWPQVVILALLAPLHGAWNSHADPANLEPTRSRWVFESRGPALALRDAFAEHDPLIAVDAAGSVPFYTRFRALDMLGLTDRYLAQNPPEGWGQGAIGHDLGDGDYVWGREPDILLFRSGLGGKPTFLSGREMFARPDFLHTYRWTVVGDDAPGGARTEVWIRTRGSALGFRRAKGRFEAPGWLFGRYRRPAVWRGGHLGPVFPRGTHEIALELPGGSWEVQVLGDAPMEVLQPSIEHPGGVRSVRFRTDTDAQLHAVVFQRPWR